MGNTACNSDPGPVTALPAPAAHPDHVVIMVVDALRADHLPIYGYDRNTAPFLTGLAEDSLVYEHAVSTSTYTPEAIGSLFTGLYPSATPWGAGWHARPAPSHPTLAMRFQNAGYKTALFSNSPMLDHPEFSRGFEVAECSTEFGLSGQSLRLVDRALAWQAEHLGEKTFVYLHFLDPHAPYAPPREAYDQFGGKRPEHPVTMAGQLRTGLPALRADGFGPGEARFEDVVQRYDAEIFDVDRAIGAYFEGLADLGRYGSTLAVVTADHGEEFLDHGFVEHAWKLYPETYRIPLMVWAPGFVVPGRQGGTVSLVDVLPTLTEVIDLPRYPLNLSGANLLEASGGRWQSKAPRGRRILELMIQSRCMIRGVVTDDALYLAYWKYLSPDECAEAAGTLKEIRKELFDGLRTPVDPWGEIVREEYYDLTRDPTCQNDLAAEKPMEVMKWRLELLEYKKICPPQLPDAYKATRDPALLTPEQAEQLKLVDPAFQELLDPDAIDPETLEALGYL